MQIFALAMAAVYATELGYNGYNDYNPGYGYNLYDSYNYGYNYGSYGYNSHRLHRRSPTVFLPPFLATKGLLKLSKVPFPIG